MNSIEKMIHELCPEGVKCVRLGEVGTFTRGNGLQKKDFTETGVPCIHYGQIYTHYGTFATETITRCSEKLASTLRKAKKGDLIIATTSENVEDVCKAVAWLGEEEVVVSSDAFIFSHNQDPKYIAYLFQTHNFFLYKQRKCNGTKVVRLSGEALADYEIPLPPLPIQTRIAAILDKFTSLEAELEAELDCRKRQYEHYRERLLNFEGRDDVEWVEMGDYFVFKNGINKGKQFFGAGDPIVNFTDVYNNRYLTAKTLKGRVQTDPKDLIAYEAKKGDVFFTRTSETREDVGMASALVEDVDRCVFSGFVLRARPKSTLWSPQFCSYYLSSSKVRSEIVRYASFTTRALTSGPRLSKIRLPKISLAEQEKIVSVLDRFERLTTDLTAGLPAEIEARRQQYEHYRDRLLTFPMAKAEK